MLERTIFRFLDLPKELRFIIYENLSITSKRLRLRPSQTSLAIEQRTAQNYDSHATIVLQTLPVQILSTCRLIHSEAVPSLSRKQDKIRDSIPRIILNADSLYTSFFEQIKTLLCALAHNLDHHPFFNSKSITPRTLRKHVESHPNYPTELQHWITQTTHLLLSQRPAPNPLEGFMGMRTYPTVRLIIEVEKLWTYNTCHSLALNSHAQAIIESQVPRGLRPVYTASVNSQLSLLYSGVADYAKGLRHVKSGAIVFGQADERAVTKDGLLVKKEAALDFGICRIVD